MRETHGDAAEENGFRERARIIEGRERFAGTADDGFRPIAPVVRAGDLRDFVVGELHLGEKFRRGDVRDEEHAFGADDD